MPLVVPVTHTQELEAMKQKLKELEEEAARLRSTQVRRWQAERAAAAARMPLK